MRGPLCRRFSLRTAICAALVSGALPVSAGLFSDDEARQALNEQAKQIVKLQSEKQALEARIAKLEETLRNQNLLDLLTQIEGLNTEIGTLRGQSEVHSNNIDTGQKRQKDFYVDLDSRLRRLEQAATAPTPADSSAPATSATPPSSSQSAPSSSPTPSNAAPAASPQDGASGTAPAIEPKSSASAPEKGSSAAPTLAATAVKAGVRTPEAGSYDAAHKLFKAGNYTAAVDGFESFLKQHPGSALASNAQYWIGNAQFAQRDYKSAIASQRKLLANYPDSQKAPDALLNIANSQTEMGDTAAARKTLEDVIARFPAGDAGDKARRRLALLK